MPSPPPLDVEFQQLVEIDHQKKALSKLEENRDKYVEEMKRLKREEEVLKKYKELMDELDQERKMHVDELRTINNDMNTLETTIKAAEEEQNRSASSAQRLILDMVRIKDSLNSLRRAKGEETLPDKIGEPEDLSKLGLSASAGNFPLHPQPFPPNLFLPPHHGFPTNYTNPNPVPRPIQTSNYPFFNNATAQKLATMSHDAETGGAGGSGDVLESPSGDVPPLKQQPAPMKTCTSCQQLIHRNAPICPMCKSKSRSKNPKKPKRRPEEH